MRQLTTTSVRTEVWGYSLEDHTLNSLVIGRTKVGTLKQLAMGFLYPQNKLGGNEGTYHPGLVGERRPLCMVSASENSGSNSANLAFFVRFPREDKVQGVDAVTYPLHD